MAYKVVVKVPEDAVKDAMREDELEEEDAIQQVINAGDYEIESHSKE